jgi:hypothetical protein
MHRLLATALIGAAVAVSAVLALRWATAPDQAPDLLLTRADDPGFGFHALPGGTLEIDLDRGCVLLSGHPVVWPNGTTLTSDPPELRFSRGLIARPGDVVRGGGGGGYAWQLRRTALMRAVEGDFERAIDCVPPHTEVFVFNSGSVMTVEPRMLVTTSGNVSELDAGTMQEGRLELDADRECILVGGRPALWPTATMLTEKPLELRLPSGEVARTGDIVRGRGWVVPAGELDRKRLWIEGDLDRTLACTPRSAVLVFRGPGTRMTVSPGG